LPLAVKLRERHQWLEWGTVSGVVAGAPFAAFDCRVSHRHLPTPSADGQNGSTVPDRAVAVLPVAPSAPVRGSMVGYSWGSHRHFGVATICLWSGRRRPPCLHNARPPSLARTVGATACYARFLPLAFFGRAGGREWRPPVPTTLSASTRS